MKPESSPREELEMRLTALLLGELSPAEAASLQQTIAQDAELGRLHDRLRQTLGLVRETVASPEQELLGSTNPPQLSQERREKLLQSFKVTRPKELERARLRTKLWRESLAVAAMLVGLLVVVTIVLSHYLQQGFLAKAKLQNITPQAALDNSRADFFLNNRDQTLAWRSGNDFNGEPAARARVNGPPDGTRKPVSDDAPPDDTTALSVVPAKEPNRLALQRSTDESLLPWNVLGVPAGTPASPPSPPSRDVNALVADLKKSDSDVGSQTARIALPELGDTLMYDRERGIKSREQSLVNGPASLVGTGFLIADSGQQVGGGGGGQGGGGGGSPINGRSSGVLFGDAADEQNRLSRLDAGDGVATKTFADRFADASGHGNTPKNDEEVKLRMIPPPATPPPLVSVVDPATGLPLRSDDSVSRTVGGVFSQPLERANQPALPARRDADGEGVPSFYQTDGFGVIEAGKKPKVEAGQKAGEAPKAGELGVSSVDAVGYVNVDLFKSRDSAKLEQLSRENLAQTKPIRESEKLPKSQVEIPLPKIPSQEIALQRESQVQSGPVVTSEISLKTQVSSGKELADVAGKHMNQPADKPAQTGSGELAELGRQLDRLREVRERLALRVAQEKSETAIPRTNIVTILDVAKAEPAQRPMLWERISRPFTSEAERSARISVEKDSADVGGLSFERSSQGFDPYYLTTEIEMIQSKTVLSKVIEKLNLNEAWAGKHGGGIKLDSEETLRLLKKKIDVRSDPKTSLIDIRAKSDTPEEAARLANAIAEAYRDRRLEAGQQVGLRGVRALEEAIDGQDREIARVEQEMERQRKELKPELTDTNLPKSAALAPIPQPEISVAENPFSTFSLNVSDVSFKLAAASLEKGQMPEPVTVRSEEFINAFDYRDPEPVGSALIAFAWERARYPFAHNRDLVRFSLKTAASGRQAGRPLNLVLLIDNSGSMERADRVRIREECLRVLAGQLEPQDRVSVVAFARTARLWVDGLPGNQAGDLPQRVGSLTPQGGTNLEDAMNLAYQTALRHYLAHGVNRVVLITDGAANLGNVEPESLQKKVEAHRRQGIALDCFGIGWEGYNDDLLEILSRNGDGRYGYVNTPEAAATDFAGQLAGALRVAASDVKVQVEFNPHRVSAYRQIGYAKHQLKQEQFRDNTVDAAEIGAAEAGNALYVVEVNPRGEGPLGTVRVRFKVPGTTDYREQEWPVPYEGKAKALEQSTAAMRLAATASAFSEWLVSSPYAAEVTPTRLLGILNGVPESCGADPRPKKLEEMIRQAGSVAGK